jgi:serine/threonine-protein kinase
VAEGIALGPYLLVRRLARGGMAEIFLARREGPEGFARELVVKRILPHLGVDAQFVQMFLEEARVAARLTHPNVVHVYDFGEVDGQYYLAMELVRGVDLSALIRRAAERARAEGRSGALPVHHAAKILSFACEGLAHAHGSRGADGAQRLVHRDVTPANVLISFDGAVKVADFGIAKAEQGSHVERTQQGVVKGKRTYLSPEQSRGERLDARSDLFNVGILLYEAVTGMPLFQFEGYRLAMDEILAGGLPGERWLADVPAPIVRPIRRALAARPEDRHEDALALRAELEAFLRTWPEPSDAVEIGAYVRALFADVVAADRAAPRAAGTVPALTVELSKPQQPLTVELSKSQAAVPVTAGIDTALTEVRVLPDAATISMTQPPTRGTAPALVAGLALAAALAVSLLAAGAWFAFSGSSALQPAVPLPVVAVATPLAPLRPRVDAPLPSARVRVSSTPPGASVEIDGVRAGTTPFEAAVSPGSHAVTLSLDGYASERSAVTLGGPGETGVLVFTLRHAARPSRPGASPAARSGTLTISTTPWSRVYLGARLLGTTPLANAALPAGRHTLTLRAPGRADKRIVVTIGADAETRVREVL